ncbi:hypothetical protein [Streptomyces sp. AM6-12]|uniref:hypothetical protein n=1 Tax=Streptomyces sp. AM6-12 TaxID=3345149 RepID=UPI003796F160
MTGSTHGSAHGRAHGSLKAMGALTASTFVAVTAYTVALGGDGWLWFGWVVLGLLTLAMAVTQA